MWVVRIMEDVYVVVVVIMMTMTTTTTTEKRTYSNSAEVNDHG